MYKLWIMYDNVKQGVMLKTYIVGLKVKLLTVYVCECVLLSILQSSVQQIHCFYYLISQTWPPFPVWNTHQNTHKPKLVSGWWSRHKLIVILFCLRQSFTKITLDLESVDVTITSRLTHSLSCLHSVSLPIWDSSKCRQYNFATLTKKQINVTYFHSSVW